MKKAVALTVLLVAVLFIYNAEAADPQKVHTPKRVKVDSNHNGKVDRVEVYDDSGNVLTVEADTTGDGMTDEWVFYEDGIPVKSERDTNADGKPDVWLEY